ncbi:MAG: ATP-dependent DNA helicase RecG, partial [Deltaproteobacteria bacterium]|nr:ATP-dependent DNA helicase RecG [Deltaproteobacteria bacterium]
MIQNLTENVKKIEAPLLFLSKDGYKNLPLVKDFEKSMLGFIAGLKKTAHTPSHGGADGTIRENEILELVETFLNFDTCSIDDKKERIDRALVIVKDMLHHCNEIIRLSPGQKTAIDADDIKRRVDSLYENLSLPVKYVKGIGPKVSELLGKKNIKTVEDLLYFFPRKYEDRRSVKQISSAIVGKRETVIGDVVNVRIQRYRNKKIFEAAIDDGSEQLVAKWFHGNFDYLRKTFKTGDRFILTGDIKSYLFEKNMIHPDFERLDEKDDELLQFKRIVPVYSETANLNQKYIRKIMMNAVHGYHSNMISPIPQTICERNELADINESIKNIHFPDSDEDIDLYNGFKSAAHRRVIFDEFFFFELGMALKKKGYILDTGIKFNVDGPLVDKFLRVLPFTLTGAQQRVIGEIHHDMAEKYPMNRLLQGDVGSGKTVVSMVSMITACQNGYQSAIMAPTEILAEQHFSNIQGWADSIDLTVCLLTGSTKKRERTEITQGIETGHINIIVGTHALIQEGINFKNLGLVVIDEQHRFGVVQRAVLREKGINPDVLVMTATPIPRTLAMTVYGDLDISVIDELPPGKKPIKTKVFYESSRHRVYDIIRKEIGKGNQVFIVYPLVEESETLDLKDATGMARHLQEDIFPEFNVGLIHGKMKGREKNKIMNQFLCKNINVLVSTTVIEVGIDIPTASLMIIEHAERFGLSQLHQLRGRVGRSDVPSYCILIVHHYGSDDARKRLRVMEHTNDGFAIAEEDLS